MIPKLATRCKGKDQIKWISDNLPILGKLNYLKERLAALNKQHQDLAKYIYVSCRCAVAHAATIWPTNPIYDPESVEDEIRFYEIKPIVFALAKIIIENEFGIEATFTIIDKHLYELQGFHKLLGEKYSTELKLGKTLSLSDIQLNTKISLRLWNHKKFKAFEKLTASVVNIKDGIVELRLSRDGRVIIPLILDFPNEKLIFEPMIGADLDDDGSQNAASQFADAYRFYGEMIANGVLEVWDSSTNQILGRLLEYLPVNIIPGTTRENLIKLEKQWRIEAKRRRGVIENR